MLAQAGPAPCCRPAYSSAAQRRHGALAMARRRCRRLPDARRPPPPAAPTRSAQGAERGTPAISIVAAAPAPARALITSRCRRQPKISRFTFRSLWLATTCLRHATPGRRRRDASAFFGIMLVYRRDRAHRSSARLLPSRPAARRPSAVDGALSLPALFRHAKMPAAAFAGNRCAVSRCSNSGAAAEVADCAARLPRP